MQLPNHYHHPMTYWAHMVTLRCPAGCPYCILNGRGRAQDGLTEELTGKQILAFWNGVQHRQGQRLSLIGGEPTLHPDIVDIVNGLEGYALTLTTNCNGVFYDQESWETLFQPHPSSTLRINTTFHPHYIEAEAYVDRVKRYKDRGYHVDQTGFVNHPEITRYEEPLKVVGQALPVRGAPFLGFWTPEDRFRAPFDPDLLYPDENYAYPDDTVNMCGLSDLDAYRDACGQYEKREVQCLHPLFSLIIGPDGKHYHCHYKMYYGIDPVGHVEAWRDTTEEDLHCRHYGYCNWCDIPRAGCFKNPTAQSLILNTYLDLGDLKTRRELCHVQEQMTSAPAEEVIYTAYAWLYAGARHRGHVFLVGDKATTARPQAFFRDRGYHVTVGSLEEAKPSRYDLVLAMGPQPYAARFWLSTLDNCLVDGGVAVLAERLDALSLGTTQLKPLGAVDYSNPGDYPICMLRKTPPSDSGLAFSKSGLASKGSLT